MTSGSTLLAVGTATTYRPRLTGRVAVFMSAILAQATTANGIQYNLYYGTGAAPSHNGAIAGDATAFASLQTIASMVTTELSTSCVLHGVVTGLVADSINSLGATVAGTTYWFDLFMASTGATVTTPTNVNMLVIEF